MRTARLRLRHGGQRADRGVSVWVGPQGGHGRPRHGGCSCCLHKTRRLGQGALNGRIWEACKAPLKEGLTPTACDVFFVLP